jgi:sugar diacid utilization regulator
MLEARAQRGERAQVTDDGTRRIPRPAKGDVDEQWLAGVGAAASHDAGDVPVALLGDYLPLLADAAITGRKPKRAELEAVEALGRQAAEQGVSAGRVVQLYLSAASRLWQELPAVVLSRDREAVRAAATAVLQVIDRAVATLAEGYAVARRDLVRREETLRRELIDDLLRGDSDLGALVDRAEPFGLDLARVHQVALAAPSRRLPDTATAITALEAVIFDRLGDRDVLVATKDGLLVVLAPADAGSALSGRASEDLGQLMHGELRRLPRGQPWQIAVGRAHPGLYGIARSYEEAREALTMAARLHLSSPVVNARDLLIYRVLLRDQPAIVELVHAVLSPLTRARGGAEPLLTTLQAYFDTGGVATETAKRIHISVRAVTYRLDRIRALTGYDPTDAAHRFTLQAAVLGARALDWPEQPLPAAG